jgi:hypothetical protein
MFKEIRINFYIFCRRNTGITTTPWLRYLPPRDTPRSLGGIGEVGSHVNPMLVEVRGVDHGHQDNYSYTPNLVTDLECCV